MSEEIKEKLDLFPNNMNDIAKEAYYQLENYITNLKQKVEQLEDMKKEIERLNNIINRIDSFVDRTIEVIKQQSTGDDEWIIERLNGIKYLIELKDSDKE